MERFKELIDLTLKHNSASDFDIELFNADLAGLFPAPGDIRLRDFTRRENMYSIFMGNQRGKLE